MPEAFQWPAYGIHPAITIPSNSITQPATSSAASVLTATGMGFDDGRLANQFRPPARITFASDLAITVIAGARYTIAGTGLTEVDNQTFYVWPVSARILELYTDADFTTGFYLTTPAIYSDYAPTHSAGTLTVKTDANDAAIVETANLGPIINAGITSGTDAGTGDNTSDPKRRSIGNWRL
jgi:hypothetical protein